MQMQGPASPPPQHSSYSSRRHSDFGDWHRGGSHHHQQQQQQQQQQQRRRPWSPCSPACERPNTPTAAAAADLAAAVAAGSGAAAACAAAGAEEAAAAADGIRVDADTAVYVRKLLPRKMAKYWLQRYSLFSKFDLGVQMDVQVRGGAGAKCRQYKHQVTLSSRHDLSCCAVACQDVTHNPELHSMP
jgi:hypothetical protein